MKTTNLTILTIPEFLYVAFKYKNPIEDYYGVVQVKNSVSGLIWHTKFIDFCIDLNIEVLKADYGLWRNVQLSEKKVDYELYKNFCTFIVHNEESFIFTIKTIQIAINQSTNFKKTRNNVKKIKSRNF